MSTVVSVHQRSPKEKTINSPNERSLQMQLLGHIRAVKIGSEIEDTSGFYKIIDITKTLASLAISAPAVDYLKLEVGGIVGDRYFFEAITLPNGLVKRRINEVNIFTQEELDRLNLLLGANCLPGSVGENILTTGIDIDALPIGTLLSVGDAVLRVSGRRTFCWKFVITFIKKDFYEPTDFFKFNRTAIGMATQVVKPGIVKACDMVQVIKIGTGPVYRANNFIKFELFRAESDIDPILPCNETINRFNC